MMCQEETDKQIKAVPAIPMQAANNASDSSSVAIQSPQGSDVFSLIAGSNSPQNTTDAMGLAQI